MNSIKSSLVMSYDNNGDHQTPPDPNETTPTNPTVDTTADTTAVAASSSTVSEEEKMSNPAPSGPMTPPRPSEFSLAPPPTPRKKRQDSREESERSQGTPPQLSTPKHSVVRRLFGEPDHEGNETYLRATFAEFSQSQQQAFSFNFTEGKPLPPSSSDRFEWEKVSTSSVVAIKKTLTKSAYSAKATVGKSSKKPVIKSRANPASTSSSSTTSARALFARCKNKSSSNDVIHVTAAGSSTSQQPTTIMDHMTVISKARVTSSRMPTVSGGIKRSLKEQEPTTSSGQEPRHHQEGEVTSTSVAIKRARMSASQANPTEVEVLVSTSSSSSEEDF